MSFELRPDVNSKMTPKKNETGRTEGTSQQFIREKAMKFLENALGDPKKVAAVMGNDRLVNAYVQQHANEIALADDLQQTEELLGVGLARFLVKNTPIENKTELGIDEDLVNRQLTKLARKNDQGKLDIEITEADLPTKEELQDILEQR